MYEVYQNKQNEFHDYMDYVTFKRLQFNIENNLRSNSAHSQHAKCYYNIAMSWQQHTLHSKD